MCVKDSREFLLRPCAFCVQLYSYTRTTAVTRACAVVALRLGPERTRLWSLDRPASPADRGPSGGVAAAADPPSPAAGGKAGRESLNLLSA